MNVPIHYWISGLMLVKSLDSNLTGLFPNPVHLSVMFTTMIHNSYDSIHVFLCEFWESTLNNHWMETSDAKKISRMNILKKKLWV